MLIVLLYSILLELFQGSTNFFVVFLKNNSKVMKSYIKRQMNKTVMCVNCSELSPLLFSSLKLNSYLLSLRKWKCANMCGEGYSHHWPVPTTANLIAELEFCYFSIFLHHVWSYFYFMLFIEYVWFYYQHILRLLRFSYERLQVSAQHNES